MNETQTNTMTSTSPSDIDVKRLVQELTSAASIIQAFFDHPENAALETIRFVPPLLKSVQEVLLEAETAYQQREEQLKEVQQIAQDVNELQTLLDVLPVGIVVARDPYNKNITINRVGLKILNLPPDADLSTLTLNGGQLPFKVLRAGKEVPFAERPMQYAVKHRVALRDVELDIQYPNGRLINLLEYASPLYDRQGNVRGSLGVLVDITARKSIEQRLIMQYNIVRVLTEANSINKAAGQVLKMICETAGWEFGALWRVEADSLTLTNEGVWHADYVDVADYAEATRYSELTGDDVSLPGFVLRNGQPLWLFSLSDFHSPDAVAAEKAGLHSGLLLPVRSGERVIAILECLSNRNQVRDQTLTEMLNAVGNQIGIFLERKLLEEALAVRANQQHLLAQAGMALSATMDYEKRLMTIVHVIVPDLADWCAIDIIDPNNILRRVAAAHVDPGKENLIYKLQPTRKVDYNQVISPQVETLLTGQSLLYTEVPFSMIEKTVVDADQLAILRELNPRSSMVVPLAAHGRIFGICTFVHSDSLRRYLSADLALAEDIVRRVALALDNAILYAESQKLNSDLERRVDERTTQLTIAVNQLTNQITERQHAEEQVRILNSELEQRIKERTSQLELANRELHNEILVRQKAGKTLRILLTRTRELYRISQAIGTVRTPSEVLSLLVSSSYLKDSSRASIALLDKAWVEDETPPEHCFILAEWNKGARQPRFLNQRFTLEEYGVILPVPYGQPLVIQDIQSETKLPEPVRKRFADLHTHSLIILPLIANGEWYGLLSLHFKTRRMTNMDDLRHVRGLVDDTAIVVKNMRLLEAESQARHEAEMANELKLKFLAMISHELRTPLTSIKGFTTTLLADDVVWPADKQLDFLQIINRESDKLSDLIEQLLDLSRMEAGILRISPKKVSLKTVIESALVQLQALINDHELVLEIPRELPLIYADGQRIAQVLTNLVGNAAKFSPKGTQIIISTRRSGEMIQVDVADQGPGIPPQDRTRVFESFRQLENGTGSRTKGAGLGLAICKGLIEAHGGMIWVQDRAGPGTVISFTLPLHGDKKTAVLSKVN
jgi:signal transduction histidine kinase/PAS domain-containing protein